MRAWHLLMIVAGLAASPASVVAQRPQPLPTVRVDGVYTQRDGRWPDSLRSRLRDSLARGRERWRATRPREYLVAAIATWGMVRMARTHEVDGQLEAARVRGDAIVEIVRQPAPQFAPAPDWRTVTIDSVFHHLERTLENPGQQIAVLKLDTLWGFPREWKTDDARNGYGSPGVSDQVSGGAIVLFAPVTPPSCGRLRRMLRRCVQT